MRYRLIYPWDERGEAAHGISAPTKHLMKELKRLPAQVKARVLLAIEELVTNPFAGIRLRGKLDGLLRWTTGD